MGGNRETSGPTDVLSNIQKCKKSRRQKLYVYSKGREFRSERTITITICITLLGNAMYIKLYYTQQSCTIILISGRQS